MDSGKIFVRGSAKKVYGAPGEGAQLWIGATKTASSTDWVPMDPVLVPLFKAEREAQEMLQRELLGRDPNVRELKSLVPADACVFPSDPSTLEGQRLPRSPNSLSGQFAVAAKRAGLKNVSPHWLRHTFASQKLSEGVPLPVVSRMLRHKHPGITASVYSHVIPGWERDPSLFRAEPQAESAAPIERMGDYKGQD